LFNELNVPVNYVADEPTSAQEILKDTYKENRTFQLVNEVYFVGMVDDAAFEGNKSLAVEKIKSDYDGILIFGVSLNQRENNLLPTRSQLAEISRAFNREFYYTPVVLVFKYADDKGQYIAFANTERLQYKQAWREGEKAGKVSLLRDIDIQRPHRGHEDIINQLRIKHLVQKPLILSPNFMLIGKRFLVLVFLTSDSIRNFQTGIFGQLSRLLSLINQPKPMLLRKMPSWMI